MTKFVKIMASYESTGIWDFNDNEMCKKDLPVSDVILSDLESWCVRYQDTYRPSFEPLDFEKFSKIGLDIANRMKKELPDWNVVYFDDCKARDKLQPHLSHIFCMMIKTDKGIEYRDDMSHGPDKNSIAIHYRDCYWNVDDMNQWFLEYANIHDCVLYREMVYFCFKDPKVAMLFKLTWIS